MRASRVPGWRGALAALVGLRVAVPLVQLAGADLPGLPPVRGHALQGDAPGLYAGAREALAAPGRLPRPALAALVLATLAVAVVLVRQYRAYPSRRPLLFLAAVWWIGLLAAVDAAEQEFSGAGAPGWPLLWAIPMLPLRALHALDQSSAFWAGLPLSLGCNAVTVVATAFAGLYATGRRSVGLGAAALYALWPFLAGVVAGHRAWENSTWSIDAGLHMYTEPLSTALVSVALALLLSPRATAPRLTAAGAALGWATTVKPPAATFAVAGAAWLAWHLRDDLRRFVWFAAGGLAFVPLLAAYWPIGYSELSSRAGGPRLAVWSVDFVGHNWSDSLLFGPRTLAVLLPAALLGVFALRDRRHATLVIAWVLACPLVYSFFRYTAIHPRYLFAGLPALLILCAAGVEALVRLAGRRAGYAIAALYVVM
jgi:hypothetical protein